VSTKRVVVGLSILCFTMANVRISIHAWTSNVIDVYGGLAATGIAGILCSRYGLALLLVTLSVTGGFILVAENLLTHGIGLLSGTVEISSPENIMALITAVVLTGLLGRSVRRHVLQESPPVSEPAERSPARVAA
jgi:hypothetical protein